MQLIIKNVTLIDPASSYHGEKVSISIKKGKIEKVGKRVPTGESKVMDMEGAFASPGWLDIGAMSGDPGFEHREDFKTLSKAALAGGYTAIACLPNTLPTIHSKSEVLYVKNHSKKSLIEFLPIGAISENCAGKDITEMYDMRAAGAVAFSDGKKPVQDSGLMMRALQYVQPFGGVIINQPLDYNIALNGQLHEGITSTSLGLRGIPSMAEELIVQRDIYLSEYTDSHIHFLNLSTAESVRLVREAKKRGVKVSASVAVMNLAVDDTILHDFNNNFKVMPPVRSHKDRAALIDGLQDGTIDCITSNHTPLEAEAKELEFLYAKFGATGLETAFALAWSVLKEHMSLEEVTGKFAFQPRKILGLTVPKIADGEKANLTVFDPTTTWTFEEKHIRSKSKNTPFIGRAFTGRVKFVVTGKRMISVGE